MAKNRSLPIVTLFVGTILPASLETNFHPSSEKQRRSHFEFLRSTYIHYFNVDTIALDHSQFLQSFFYFHRNFIAITSENQENLKNIMRLNISVTDYSKEVKFYATTTWCIRIRRSKKIGRL